MYLTALETISELVAQLILIEVRRAVQLTLWARMTQVRDLTTRLKMLKRNI